APLRFGDRVKCPLLSFWAGLLFFGLCQFSSSLLCGPITFTTARHRKAAHNTAWGRRQWRTAKFPHTRCAFGTRCRTGGTPTKRLPKPQVSLGGRRKTTRNVSSRLVWLKSKPLGRRGGFELRREIATILPDLRAPRNYSGCETAFSIHSRPQSD